MRQLSVVSQLRNVRHEKFAEFVADGLPQSEAYRRVVGNGASAKNANVHADEWASRPGVKERIDEPEAESAARSGRSREELITRLWAILDTGAGAVAKGSQLCQSYRTGEHGTEVRMPDKIAAAQLLVKMCGWAQPNRIELSARDTLAEFITSIREAPRRTGIPDYAEANGERG